MSTLCDSQLTELCLVGMVAPFEAGLVNPASIDLRMGNTYRIATPLGWSGPIPYDAVDIVRGQQYLFDTLEYVNIPVRCMAEMWLKSSAGRKGLNVYKAGYIDPGFHGTITFRLWNDVPVPVTIKPGDRVIQMVVREMSKVPDKPYTMTGRYNGQTGPTEAR